MKKLDNETYEEFCLRQANYYVTWWMIRKAIQIFSQISRMEFEQRTEDKNE